MTEPEKPRAAAPAELTRSTLAGLRWTYAQTLVSAFLQIAIAAILARVLTPEAYGLVAIGDLTLRFVNYFARGGITQAIVQKADLRNVDIRAGWTASLGLASVFYAVAWVLAPVAGNVFNNADVVPVLRWMALSLLLFGLGATADALLRRAMRFKALAILQVGSYVLGYGIVGLILALNGAGVWALVAATLTQTGSNALVSYAVARHDIRLTFNRDAHQAVLSFGGRVSIIGFLEFLGGELDTLAVGRFAGTASLGLYNRAYLLVRLPVYQLTTSLSKVLFPVFAAVQKERARLRTAYFAAVKLTSAVVVPIAAGMAAAREEIVLVLLGDQWTDAIAVMPGIAIAAAIGMITHFGALMAESLGALNRKLLISSIRVTTLALALLLAARGPLAGYGYALAAGSLASHIGYVLLSAKLLEVSPLRIIENYIGSIVAGVIVFGLLTGVHVAGVAASLPVGVVLILQIATGAIALPAMIAIGPLAGVRHELRARLGNAGLLSGTHLVHRAIRAVLGQEKGT